MNHIKLNQIILFLSFVLIAAVPVSALEEGRIIPSASYTTLADTAESPQIAVILPLSGPFSELGEMMKAGYESGFSQNDDSFGRTDSSYRVKYFDSEANPETVRNLVEELSRTESVAIATGTPLNATAWSASRAAEKNGLPYLIVGADQDNLVDSYSLNTFRLTPEQSDLLLTLQKFIAVQNPAIKTMGIIYGDSACAVNQARKLRKLCAEKNIDLVIWQSWKTYPRKRNNFFDILNQIKEHQPQILFIVTKQALANRLWQQGQKLEIMPQTTISIPVNCLNSKSSLSAEELPAAQLIYAGTKRNYPVKMNPTPESALTQETDSDTPLLAKTKVNLFFAISKAAARYITSSLDKSTNLTPDEVIKNMKSIKIDPISGISSFTGETSNKLNVIPCSLLRNDENGHCEAIFPNPGNN